jgi:hypothetical protein
VLDSMDDPKTTCDIDYCPGVTEEPSLTYAVYEATIHPTCFNATIRKLPEYPTGCYDEIFSSSVCCTWPE